MSERAPEKATHSWLLQNKPKKLVGTIGSRALWMDCQESQFASASNLLLCVCDSFHTSKLLFIFSFSAFWWFFFSLLGNQNEWGWERFEWIIYVFSCKVSRQLKISVWSRPLTYQFGAFLSWSWPLRRAFARGISAALVHIVNNKSWNWFEKLAVEILSRPQHPLPINFMGLTILGQKQDFHGVENTDR